MRKVAKHLIVEILSRIWSLKVYYLKNLSWYFEKVHSPIYSAKLITCSRKDLKSGY